MRGPLRYVIVRGYFEKRKKSVGLCYIINHFSKKSGVLKEIETFFKPQGFAVLPTAPLYSFLLLYPELY